MHGPSRIIHKYQLTNLGFHCASKKGLSDIAWIIYYSFFYENHVNNTETLGKGKEFTYKNFKYISVHWDRCQAKSGKLMFVANYTIVDWDPMVCSYLTVQMILIALYVIMLLKQYGRLPILRWNVTKDFLAGLTVEWHPLALESSSINGLDLNNETFGSLPQAPKNL